MNKVVLLVLHILLIFYSTAFAQSEPVKNKPVGLPFPGQLMKREPEGNYLGPLITLKSNENEYLASEQWYSFFLDMMSYANSYVGNYAEAIAYQDKQNIEKANKKLVEINSSSLDAYYPKNALDAIATVADREQVIMINEYHHVPMHRAFTARLLPILYKKGFRYLAVEAVSDTDAELNKRKYPVYKTGGYTSEPVFGNMLRTALKLGFKVVPYEFREKCQPKTDNPYFCQNERERGQAQNIYEKIVKEDPKAKILVHAGMGHVQEDVYNKDLSIMAAHFKVITKIDPFTIDQIQMIEHSAAEFEEPEYRYALRQNSLKAPAVFQSQSGIFWKKQPGQFSSVDAQVFHPRVVYQNGRPDWLHRNGSNKKYAADFKKLNLAVRQQKFIGTEPLLLQAFIAGENPSAVPVDQVVLYPNRQIPSLLLPKGNFRLRAINKSGKTIAEYQN